MRRPCRIISFLVFLKNFLYINDLEINRIFDQQLVELTGGTINMGVIDIVKRQERQEGLQQGLQQGAEQKSFEIVKNLIQELSLSDEHAARIAGVSVDFVRKIRAELSQKKRG